MNQANQNNQQHAAGEAELRDKFRNLLQYTTDLVYFKDLDGKFTLASASLERRLTQSENETIVGKSDFDFHDKEIVEQFCQDDTKIIETGEPLTGRVEKEVRDGKELWMATSKMPLRDRQGNIVGIFGISRDVTEQEHTKKKLKETNARLLTASRQAGKAEIANDVILNVGSVLNSINVAFTQSSEACERLSLGRLEEVTELIETQGSREGFFTEDPQGSKIPDYLRNVAEANQEGQARLKRELADCEQHLDHIIEIISKQQKYAANVKVIETVNIADLISNATTMCANILSSHDIELQQDFDPSLTVQTDRHQVLQITVDLLRNAIAACVKSENTDRMVTISAGTHGEDQFSICIKDNGIGILKENFAELFSYDFSSTSDGSGFGLQGCANTAKEMGGSLDVSSDGIGKGASFTLTLPTTSTGSCVQTLDLS